MEKAAAEPAGCLPLGNSWNVSIAMPDFRYFTYAAQSTLFTRWRQPVWDENVWKCGRMVPDWWAASMVFTAHHLIYNNMKYQIEP